MNWTWASVGAPHSVTFLGGNPPLADFTPAEPGELLLGPSFFPVGPVGPEATYPMADIISSGAQPEGGDAPFTFQLTFTEPGMYNYRCVFHPGMTGTVQVVSPIRRFSRRRTRQNSEERQI